MKISWRNLAVFLCIITFLACGRRLNLPNGYSLKRTQNRSDGGVIGLQGPIEHDGKIWSRPEVVFPVIKKYSVYKNYIFGFADSIEEFDGFVTPGGYFVCNTKTGEVKQGLSKKELISYAKSQLGLSEIPELLSVSHVR